ncbi:MAG: class I SAM-dependent methyltransferase [Clostridia bacterium]|nr:class I SAM-dependent methyltransferase [Clostridia bacterium]
MKLERWGNYILERPDPQVIWRKTGADKKPDAYYERSSDGGGRWIENNPVDKQWRIKWRDLTFIVKLMGFKHTGVFPEQAANWEWMMRRIGMYKGRFNVLNLFGYTGGATLACAKAGASVVHVDASKGMVSQCKENAKISGLADAHIRYIVDDAFKFVEREIRRGNIYQGIIMDPPSYGRGPNGQIWKIETSVYDLVESCTRLMDKSADFMLINSYTTGLQPTVMANILKMCVKQRGNVTADEIGIVQDKSDVILPCGCFARWEAK